MSTDYVVVCDVCKTFAALGYRSGLTFHFGSDDAGRLAAGIFIMAHADHHPLYQQGGSERGGLRVVDQQCDSYGDYKNEGKE